MKTFYRRRIAYKFDSSEIDNDKKSDFFSAVHLDICNISSSLMVMVNFSNTVKIKIKNHREESKLTIIVPKSKNLTLLLLTFKGHLFFLIIQNRNNLFVSSAKMNLIM
jgi:hypothetical protein